jgi:hypothetical protein
MKKALLFLSLALFLSAGIITATKIQAVNSTSVESIVEASDLDSIVPFADDDEKDKTKKATKSDKCASSKDCSKEKCSEKGEKTAQLKENCDSKAKQCCSKDKGKK